MENISQVATLAGGCFWCLEAIFTDLQGVESVQSGYSGGKVPNPTYHEVCDGNTGHAEVVQVTFNLEILSYRDLLEHPWTNIEDNFTVEGVVKDTARHRAG